MKIKELLVLADDAYYAAQYDKAIELYQQVLESAPKNKDAQEQLKKAEFQRSLKATAPNVPNEALQLYRRARSFIIAGDMQSASKLLKEAVSVAKKFGAKFPQAQELLDNLSNVFAANERKGQALEQLELRQWANATENLSKAVELDPTDKTAFYLLEHLRALIKAQGQISQLAAGIKDRGNHSNTISEIQKVIEETNHIVALSVLWQEVVREFGEYNKNRNSISQNSIGIIIVLVIGSGIVGGISAQYFWSAGVYIASAMLMVAFVIALLAFARK